MYCKNCGKEVDGKFCGNCGTNNELIEVSNTQISNKNDLKNTSNNENKPKQPIFKKWWFWVIVVVLILTAIGSSQETAQQNKDTSQSSTQIPQKNNSTDVNQNKENNQKNEQATNNNMPSIKGSQAYDIILSIEQKTGIKKPKTTKITDGYSWNGTNSQYSYTINSAYNHEISYAQFMVLADGDNTFLGFCASMPYNQAENEKAMDWVNQHIGQETSTIIGDAEFSLTNGKLGPILTIKAIGYDDYLTNYILNPQ